MSGTALKSIEVEFRVHRDVPGCCRGAITNYLATDRMQPYQEPGDRIACGCGNSLVWDRRGWRLYRVSKHDTEAAA